MGSESPVPGLSYMTTRANVASRRSSATKWGSLHMRSRWEMNPGTQTMSRGPDPNTW